MKKSIKKLSLNKTTISNLDVSVMHQKAGGAKPNQNVDKTYACSLFGAGCSGTSCNCSIHTSCMPSIGLCPPTVGRCKLTVSVCV